MNLLYEMNALSDLDIDTMRAAEAGANRHNWHDRLSYTTIVVQRALGRVLLKAIPFSVTYASEDEPHVYYIGKDGVIYEGDAADLCTYIRLADLPNSSKHAMRAAINSL